MFTGFHPKVTTLSLKIHAEITAEIPGVYIITKTAGIVSPAPLNIHRKIPAEMILVMSRKTRI